MVKEIINEYHLEEKHLQMSKEMLKKIIDHMNKEQSKSEGFDSCDWPSNLKLDSNREFFRPCDREI